MSLGTGAQKVSGEQKPQRFANKSNWSAKINKEQRMRKATSYKGPANPQKGHPAGHML